MQDYGRQSRNFYTTIPDTSLADWSLGRSNFAEDPRMSGGWGDYHEQRRESSSVSDPRGEDRRGGKRRSSSHKRDDKSTKEARTVE